MLLSEPIAFTAESLDAAADVYRRAGFVILRDLYPDSLLSAMEGQLADAQQRLTAGELDARYGTDLLDEPGAVIDGQPYRHYVIHCTDLSPAAREASMHPTIRQFAEVVFGAEAWINDYAKFGVVYQDSRSDPGSHYSRIGWHSDFQSDEDSPAWPGFAFTIHLDGTSPTNGFLRVVPGSHTWEVDKDDLGSRGFDPIDGEIPVYAQRGDVILHDYRLWHGAARGTADGAAGQRRHVRGACYVGQRYAADLGIGTFYKNAAR